MYRGSGDFNGFCQGFNEDKLWQRVVVLEMLGIDGLNYVWFV